MECGSMHAAIEHEKKYVDVFTMLDWISIFGRARRPHPYKVKNFHYKNFSDFQKLAKDTMNNRRRDENGNIINWVLVKSFMYLKDQHGQLYYRYNYSDEYKIITVSGPGRYSSVTELLPAYKSNIHISQAKHHDLVKLCNQMVIPAEGHNLYNRTIPTSARPVDTLPHTTFN